MKYLVYLLPFVYIQLAPSAAMIATLATYVIKSRQNEIITWTSAGQSVYRLLLPCLLLMILLGVINWQVQERIAPHANQRQDELRSQIRSRGALANKSGKFWVANDRRIYSFQLAPQSDNSVASDNDTRSSSSCPVICAVRNLTIYEFDQTGENLQTLYRSQTAVWENDQIKFQGPVEKTTLSSTGVATSQSIGGEVTELSNPFMELRKKPSHLNISETRAQLESSEAEVEKRNFAVALDKKYAT
jgi:lipopolysaccharide export LptBFGC system permease protein LptF